MKIALIAPEKLPVPPVLGGAVEQTLFEMALTLKSPQCTVVSPWAKALETAPQHATHTFRHVHVTRQKKHIKKVLGKNHPEILKNKSIARTFHYLNGVSDCLTDIEADIIQIHNRPEFLPYIKRQFPNKRLVLYMHNEFDYANPRLRAAIEQTDHLIFVSHFLAERFKEHFPNCKATRLVLHNSVDTKTWHPKLAQHPKTESIRNQFNLHKNKTILFVGRTSQVKGIHCLIEAVGKIKKQVPQVKLLIVGSPFFGSVTKDAFTEKLKQKAAQLEDTVAFTGFVDHKQTPFYYAAASIAVLPSLFQDPLPKVVLEAFASGKPFIGSKRGGIPEMVKHGTDGYLIENPKNIHHLSETILNLLNDPSRQKKMGKRARKKSETQFTPSIRLEKLQNFYATF